MTVSESEIVLTVGNLPLDIFANLITGQRDNQIEVHFDDVNYASYLTHSTVGGGSGGSRAQAAGQVRYSSGTAATGRSRATTLDVIKYRPMHETYAAWTAAFLVAGEVNSWQRVGLFDDTNGVFVGYEGAAYGITHRVSGVDTFVPRASWHDPCDGSVGSAFTEHGVPVVLNPAMSQVYRLRMGWLGSAGFAVEVLSPDWTWVEIHHDHRPNASQLPFFSNADLGMALDVGKTSGATNFIVATNCWAGGTTSDKARLSDPITDRTLALTTRSVITGKTTAGGGSYVDVKVAPSGALVADVSGSAVSDGHPDPQLDALTDAELRAAPVVVDTGLTPQTDALTDAELRATPVTVDTGLTTQTDALTDTELRAAPVSTRDAGVLPSAHQATGPVTNQVLLDPGAQSLVIRKFHLHADPALAAGTYPVVTLKLGTTVIFEDKFEPGLPYAEGIPIFGVPGEQLTVSVTTTATIYINIRHELV